MYQPENIAAKVRDFLDSEIEGQRVRDWLPKYPIILQKIADNYYTKRDEDVEKFQELLRQYRITDFFPADPHITYEQMIETMWNAPIPRRIVNIPNYWDMVREAVYSNHMLQAMKQKSEVFNTVLLSALNDLESGTASTDNHVRDINWGIESLEAPGFIQPFEFGRAQGNYRLSEGRSNQDRALSAIVPLMFAQKLEEHSTQEDKGMRTALEKFLRELSKAVAQSYGDRAAGTIAGRITRTGFFRE